MNLGANNAVVLSLPQFDDKMADDVWKDYLKTFDGKTKRVRRSDESFTDDASIPYISASTLDLYSLVQESGSGSELVLWIDLGGAWLESSTNPEAYEGTLAFLDGYQKQLRVAYIEYELEVEEDELKDMEKDLSKLERDNEKLHQEIEDWRQKIAENEESIKQNVSEQETLKNTIEMQKEEIRKVNVKLANAKN
jgi:hypothetical protein